MMRCDRSRGTGVVAGVVRLGTLLTLVGSAGAALPGCSEEQSPRGERRAAEQSGSGSHTVAWLEISSPISPAQWLVSRGEPRPRPVSDPEVRRVAAQLATAHTRYRESDRMIANRSMQLSDMLDRIGIREGATDILDDLTSIGGEVGQTEGFGAISQYYFNLRAASTSRAAALATLKTRYGPKS